jgi:hypothetical protein
MQTTYFPSPWAIRLQIFFVFLIINLTLISELNAQICGYCPNLSVLKTNFSEEFNIQSKKYKYDSNNLQNSVYLNSYYRGDGQLTYSFIRLDTTGKIFISCNYCTVPNKDEILLSNQGYWGRYGIHNGQIVAQLYNNDTKYYFVFGVIDSNKMIFQYHKKRRNLCMKIQRPIRIYERI